MGKWVNLLKESTVEDKSLRIGGDYCIFVRRMETKVVKVDAQDADIANIKEAAAVVDAGGLVGFPTETVYGIACRAETFSIEKLNKLKRRVSDKPYTLHISEKGEAKRYVPAFGLKGQKLIERGWPGPLTIVFELGGEDVEKQRKSLEKAVFESLYKDNCIGIRCPDNAIASILLQAAEWPVVAPSANVTGEQPVADAEGVLKRFSGQIELLLDGGPCRYQKSSTVVKIGKGRLEILRPGVYSKVEIEEMSEIRFLFVCTGNTCRSPMAVGIFRKYLAEKLKCDVDRLDEMGYKISSAGILNMAASPASDGAIAACSAKGIDIKAHKSRQLSRELIEESDLIYALERMHQESIIALCPESANKCLLLAEDRDVPGPIGQPQSVFDNCAGLIEKAVKKRIGELLL